jgi:hypothetical protein
MSATPKIVKIVVTALSDVDPPFHRWLTGPSLANASGCDRPLRGCHASHWLGNPNPPREQGTHIPRVSKGHMRHDLNGDANTSIVGSLVYPSLTRRVGMATKIRPGGSCGREFRPNSSGWC